MTVINVIRDTIKTLRMETTDVNDGFKIKANKDNRTRVTFTI